MAYRKRYNCQVGSSSDFDQHRDDSLDHNFCRACSTEFTSWTRLKEHWVKTPDHSYCQYCNIHFEYPSELEDHCLRRRHSYCMSCNRVSVDKHSLQQHYSQSSRHHYCLLCERDFQSENNLRNHINSSIHQPKDVDCPFEECDMGFVSRSALVLHLEYGRCESGTNRDIIDKNARYYDRDNIITDYQDYICPDSTCWTRFATLSALCQHIESERCRAFRSKRVWSIVDRILGRMPRHAI